MTTVKQSTVRWEIEPNCARADMLGISYVATMIFVSILSILALGIPSISILAQTGSVSQRTVLSLTVIMLLASAFFFSRVYSRSHSPIVYWYSLGLATTSFSFLAFFLTRTNGDLATWTGIGGLCLGSVYFLLSVLAAPKALGARKPLNELGESYGIKSERAGSGVC